MINQDELRRLARIVKAEEDIPFKEMAVDLLCMTTHSFYNWLNGSAKLSEHKAKELEDYLINFLP